MTAPVVVVRDLEVEFPGDPPVHAVRGVSFEVRRGERVGIVGESGCGKSVTAMSLLGLVDPPGRITAGSITVGGCDVLTSTPAELRSLRGSKIAMIFQDPMTSLNPVFRIGSQIASVLEHHGWDDRQRRDARVVELLRAVGIPDPERRIRAYPHELSGGMRQRVMIAMAVANEPAVLVADEPTTALDVTVEAQIVLLLEDLADRIGTAVVFISHDLRLVFELCDRVLVFYAGRIVEEGPVGDVFSNPRHPYTRALLQLAFPSRGEDGRASIPGSPPDLARSIVGCAFAPRCGYRADLCVEEPPLVGTSIHRVACWLGERT